MGWWRGTQSDMMRQNGSVVEGDNKSGKGDKDSGGKGGKGRRQLNQAIITPDKSF
jgi:hypothetical protein